MKALNIIQCDPDLTRLYQGIGRPGQVVLNYFGVAIDIIEASESRGMDPLKAAVQMIATLCRQKQEDIDAIVEKYKLKPATILGETVIHGGYRGKGACPWVIRTYVESQGRDELAGERNCSLPFDHEGGHK